MLLLAAVLLSSCLASGVDVPDSSETQEYSAVVRPDRAEFVYPPATQEVWEWNRPGGEGADYVWSVTVMNGKSGYELGAYRFTSKGPDPVRGSLADLIAACQHSVFWLSNGGGSLLANCEVTVDDRKRVHVVFTDAKTLGKMFAPQQPASVVMSTTAPQGGKTKQIPVVYQNWQPAPPPPERPHASSPEALAFLRDKVDQTMYHIEAQGAVEAKLTCQVDLHGHGDLTIRAEWKKEPHQVTIDVSSGTFGKEQLDEMRAKMSATAYNWLEMMLLSSSTVARDLVVTRSTDGDLVKITLWPKDLEQHQPFAHRWYDASGKLVKEVSLGDGPSGPYESEIEIDCERAGGAEGRFLVIRRNGSPIEHDLRDGFHRITTQWDQDVPFHCTVEIRTAKDLGR
jgi:hypothetical protein